MQVKRNQDDEYYLRQVEENNRRKSIHQNSLICKTKQEKLDFFNKYWDQIYSDDSFDDLIDTIKGEFIGTNFPGCDVSSMESNLEEWENNFEEAYEIFFEIVSEGGDNYALDFQQKFVEEIVEKYKIISFNSFFEEMVEKFKLEIFNSFFEEKDNFYQITIDYEQEQIDYYEIFGQRGSRNEFKGISINNSEDIFYASNYQELKKMGYEIKKIYRNIKDIEDGAKFNECYGRQWYRM